MIGDLCECNMQLCWPFSLCAFSPYSMHFSTERFIHLKPFADMMTVETMLHTVILHPRNTKKTPKIIIQRKQPFFYCTSPTVPISQTYRTKRVYMVCDFVTYIARVKYLDHLPSKKPTTDPYFGRSENTSLVFARFCSKQNPR